jgi:hypothetical protein
MSTDIPLLAAKMNNFAATFDPRYVTVADMLFDSFVWSNNNNKWRKHARNDVMYVSINVSNKTQF